MQRAPRKNPDLSAAERRPKPRKRVLWSGIVTYGEGTYSLNCTIRDLSESGARIAIPRNAQIPTNFFLINVREQLAYEARMVWNDGREVGMAIMRTIPLPETGDPALDFLKRHWQARAPR